MESQLLHSWNTFESTTNSKNFLFEDGNDYIGPSIGATSNYMSGSYMFAKPDLVVNVISRIALDACLVDLIHTKTEQTSDKQSSIKSELIDRLTYQANIDQTGRAFMYDLYWSLLDEGTIAIVPIDTTSKLTESTSYEINTMRVGKVLESYPRKVKVQCYNDKTGLRQDIILPKEKVAIIESPLYQILRETNMTLQLLKQKIDLMRSQDMNVATGKLNGFIQFPFATNNARRMERAKARRSELESELKNNAYGLATLDAEEKFIPAGAGLQNNVLEDIRKLEQDFYNQTGITESIINGTAKPEELLLYYYRTVDPIIQSVLDAINVTFITKTAKTQGHAIKFFRDPFRLVSVETMANTADLFSRNAILTPNEIRAFIGKPPHPSYLADQLFNRNIADGNQNGGTATPGQGDMADDGNNTGETIDIYDDGKGGYEDADGNPVDENGNPL